MSESKESADLKLMEEFDVKVPFTVEIIYDSDDDKSPANQSENNENNQANVLDDILSGIIEDLTNVSQKSNQIDQTSSKNRRLSSESTPVKRAKTNKNDDGNNIQVAETLNMEYRAENIQNNQVVSVEVQQSSINNQTLYASQRSNDTGRQATDQCAPYSQHNTQTPQITTNTTWQDTNNNTRLCPVNNSYTANTRQTSDNGQSIYSYLNSQNSTNNSIHPLTSLSQMIVSQNQVDLHTKTSEYIATLLTTVSSHLVLVMKAWTQYMHVCKSTNKRNESYGADIAYKQYRETKYHFFYLSFASVNNTLLPKENDHVFINKFIEYTLDVARSRNVYVTYQDMRTVLNELFAWAKSFRYPLLNGLLRPPAEPHPQGHTNNRSQEQQGWQCESINNAGNVRYRTELPGSRVINVNSSAIGTTQPVQNVNTPVQSLTYNETLSQDRRPEPQSLANPSSFVEEFQAFTRQEHLSLFGGVAENPKKNAGTKKRAYKLKKNHPVVTVQEVQAQSLPPPSYEDSTTQRNYSFHLISPANYDSFQTENQACEVNRSLSRDSGIMSPKSPANNLNDSVFMTPLITHVTSLNPNATQIKDGVCLVCGALTKQMCLGCYKTYYCSNQCQIFDWSRHVGFCK